MFKRIPSAPPGIVAFQAEGKITDSDYKTILVPAVDAAIKEHGKARILIRFGPEFGTYTAHAMLDDAVFGTAHYTAFERIAMVTDIGWLANSMRFFAPLIPGKMRV
ncbi:MAG: STAS/SEC14 domain-containing protein, partial [Hyphomonas sp.]